MFDDEWVTTGPHQFVDCWCGHTEPSPLNGKTLDFQVDRTHQWINLGCAPDCALRSQIHGHVHVHCPACAAQITNGNCCAPASMT